MLRHKKISLVNAFNLVPVVEQILPERQKIEVGLIAYLQASLLPFSGGVLVCLGAVLVCWDTVWVGHLLLLGGAEVSSGKSAFSIKAERSYTAWS